MFTKLLQYNIHIICTGPKITILSDVAVCVIFQRQKRDNLSHFNVSNF